MDYLLSPSALSTVCDTATVFVIPFSIYVDSLASGVPANEIRWLWSPKFGGASQRVADLELLPDFRSPSWTSELWL